MKKAYAQRILARRTGRIARPGALLLFSLLLAGCAAASPSALDPRGPAAQSIANLWWFLLITGTVVYVGVLGYMFFALFHRGDRNPDDMSNAGSRTRVVIYAGIIGPGVILLVTFGMTMGVLQALSEPEETPQLEILVIGHQWWWEVRYPEQQFVTANEIHIPVGEPVRIRMTSDDVIHSFWVPQLHGKLDLNPGDTNEFWIQADEAGDYWGECAEFCGVQHAKMQFVVVAEPAEQLAAWMAQQQRPARTPQDLEAVRGLDIFLESECVFCHTVKGTPATGNLGPDLTHLASRRTLAAGAIPNTRGHLTGWIMGPQQIKPGSLMPPSDLTGSELQALLAYLVTLE